MSNPMHNLTKLRQAAECAALSYGTACRQYLSNTDPNLAAGLLAEYLRAGKQATRTRQALESAAADPQPKRY